MTEPRLAELYDGIHAHAQSLVSHATDYDADAKSISAAVAEIAAISKELSDFTIALTSARLGHYAATVQKLARRASALSRLLMVPGERTRTRGEQIGRAISALVALADGTQDPTEPGIPLADVAVADAGVCPTCGHPVDDGTRPG